MAYSIVESVSQQLGTLLVAEAKYLYGVRDNVEKLQRQLMHMKCFLQDADNREHQDAQVQQWVAEIREIAYEAEDIIERYVHEVSHHQKSGLCNTLTWFCCLIYDARTLHEVGSNIEGLRARITPLTSRLQSYGIRKSKSSTHIEEHVVGLEKHVVNVVNDLSNEESRILLTPRNDGLLTHDPDPNVKLYQLQFPNDDEAWTLLREKALFSRRKKDDKPKMEALGREMLKHCGGLSLAIVALGGVLATKSTVHEWEDVRNRITLTREKGEGKSGRLSSVLELSFYELPFYLKPCFLYLGHFPKGYKISAERLYLLWEAEGIVSATAYEEAQNQGVSCLEIAERYLNELVRRSMVQVEECNWLNGKIKSCRLHDVMHDVCLKKCKEVNYLSVVELGDLHNPSSRIASSLAKSKKIHRCAIHQLHSTKEPERLQSFEDSFFYHHKSNACCLRSLLGLPFEVDDGTNFFSSRVMKNFSLLRVLDLEGCIMHNIPKVIGGLILLRYLSLKGLHFRKLPSCICDLKYLETLVLESGDDVVMLLPNKFWKMERLKHLYLPRKFEIKQSKKLTIGSSDHHQQSQMETLKNFDPNKCEMEGLRSMTNLRIFSFNEDYILDANEDWMVLLQSPLMKSCQLMNCLELRIDAKIINHPETFASPEVEAISSLEIRGTTNVEFYHFPQGLLRLKLDGCEISAEAISELEKLPHLKELVLVNNALRNSKIITSAKGFPRLVALQVENLQHLEEWELLGKDTLPILRDLNVKGCPKWDGWPKGGDLPKLRNVSIE